MYKKKKKNKKEGFYLHYHNLIEEVKRAVEKFEAKVGDVVKYNFTVEK